MSYPSIKLNTGADFPLLGIGTFDVPRSETKEEVVTALKVGYRHIDCAEGYANEVDVGEALKECIPSVCKREELFVTTKIWLCDFEPEDVETSLKISLQKLGLDYIDLYLIHFPIKWRLRGPKRDPKDIMNWCKAFGSDFESLNYSSEWFLPTWRAMEACYEKGLTKAIGISNFSVSKIKDMLTFCKVKPAVNQIEVHPGLTNKEVVEFCQANGIQVTAFSPLGCPGIDFSWFKITDPINLFELPLIKSLAEKYKKSPAQICLRWGVERNVAVIPKSVRAGRIEENFRIFDFRLTKDEVDQINGLDCNYRVCNGKNFFNDEKDIKELYE